VITELASKGSNAAVDMCLLDEDTYNFLVFLVRGVYLIFKFILFSSCRGSLVFCLHQVTLYK
jgi:hypothetical protein